MEAAGYMGGKHAVERQWSLYVHSVSLSHSAVSFITFSITVCIFVLFLIQNITHFLKCTAI